MEETNVENTNLENTNVENTNVVNTKVDKKWYVVRAVSGQENKIKAYIENEKVDKKWYVVRAVSGQENKIKAYIENEISRLGLEDFVDQVLVPTEKVIQIRKGKKVQKDKVYFPGYIMVQANLSGEIPHIIKSITNVIGFLGETKGGEPVPLRQSEVNRMLGKVDELSLEADQNVAIPFVKGETVKVIDGPFNGFDGTVENINEEKRKLEVMVKIFGRKTPLELSYMQVDKI